MQIPFRLRRRSSRHRDDRAVALVEAALVMPIVASLLFGVFEFGFFLRDRLGLTTAVREAVRTAAVGGNATSTDYDTIQMFLKRAKGIDQSKITRIVIYKASSPTAAVPTACKTASVATGGVYCNSYGTSSLSLDSSSFTGAASAPDGSWPPSSRNVSASGPPDYVGVYVKVKHTSITGLISTATRDLEADEVLQLEPSTT